jgi:hypothetical protein
MEARLFKKDSKDCDYLLVSLDEQSLFYLNQDMPLRAAFFVDDNSDLPWYKRKCTVAIIGKNLDFEKHKGYTEGVFKRGLIDKNYLISYMKEMKKKLVKMAVDEMEIFDQGLQLEDHTQEAIQASEEKSKSEPLEIISEPVEEPEEEIDMLEVSKMLRVSPMTILNLTKKGLIKGEHSGSGFFIKSDIENLLKEEPDFLKKIWNHSRSLSKREQYSEELKDGDEVFIHIRKAEKIISLSRTTMTLYAKIGLIRNKKERGKDYYISIKHMEELKANPPDWLKKSWSYFNNGKEA